MTSKTVELRRAVAGDRPALRDVLARPGTRVVLLAGSEDPNAKMTIVLIDAYGPAFAVKIPTTLAAEAVVRREGRSLEALAAMPLGSLGTSIPRRIGALVHEGRTALVATALAGTPMTIDYHGWHHTGRRRHVRRDFAAAGAWLAELHARTAGLHQPVALIDGALERLGRRFAHHPDLAAARRALAAPAGRLGAHMTPRTVVHGDYWYGNLLVDRHHVVGVVDWESCELSGEPLRDVARFAVSYALYLDRHTRPGRKVAGHKGLRADSWGAGITYALSGKGWFSAITQNYLMVTMGRLGLPGYLWRDVLLGGVADVAATADHENFAEAHLSLLAQQAPRRPVASTPAPVAEESTPAGDAVTDDTVADETVADDTVADEPAVVEAAPVTAEPTFVEEPFVGRSVVEEPVDDEAPAAGEAPPEDDPNRVVTIEMTSLARFLRSETDVDDVVPWDDTVAKADVAATASRPPAPAKRRRTNARRKRSR